MWKAITEFFLKAHSSGLGHDAIIEILVALIGVMIAVLTLLLGIFAATVGVLGFFGYQTLKDEAVKRAETVANHVSIKTAKVTAENIAFEVASKTASDVAKVIAEDVAADIAVRTATDIGTEIVNKAVREREAVEIVVSQNLPDEEDAVNVVPSIQAEGVGAETAPVRETGRESIQGDIDLQRGDK